MKTNELLQSLAQRMSALGEHKQKWEDRFELDNPATALVKLVEEDHDWFDFTTMNVTNEIPVGTEVIMYVDTMGEWLDGIVRGYVQGDGRYSSHFIVQEEGKAVYEAIAASYVAPRAVAKYVESVEAILSVELPNITDYLFWALPIESDLGTVDKVHLMKQEGVAIVEVYNGVTMDKLLYRLDGTPLFTLPSQASNEGLYLRNTKGAEEEASNHIINGFFEQYGTQTNDERFARVLAKLIATKRAIIPTAPEAEWGITIADAKDAISALPKPAHLITHIPNADALRFIVNSFGFVYDDRSASRQHNVFPCTFRILDEARYSVSSDIDPNGSYRMVYTDFMNYVQSIHQAKTSHQEETSRTKHQGKQRYPVMSFPVRCQIGNVDSVNKLDHDAYRLLISTVATMAYRAPLEVGYGSSGEPLNKVLATLEQFRLTNQAPTQDDIRHYIENAIHSMRDTVDQTASDIVADLEKVGALSHSLTANSTEGHC